MNDLFKDPITNKFWAKFIPTKFQLQNYYKGSQLAQVTLESSEHAIIGWILAETFHDLGISVALPSSSTA